MVEKLSMLEEQKVEKDYQYKVAIIGKIKHFSRIKNTREFNYIYNNSTKVWHTPYFVLFFKRNDDYKVGFVASKKIGNAIKRNRAKRLLRALFIQNCDILSSGSYIFVAKPSIIEEKFTKLHKSFTYTLKKSGTLKEI
jgi:ribonuclease P protein component